MADEPEPLFGGTIQKYPNEYVEVFDRIIDGIRCRATYHHGLGHMCGYIEIPKGAEYHNIRSYDECKWDMHGGATYFAINGFPPEENEEGMHVIGFDCIHEGDAPHPSSSVAKYYRPTCKRHKFCDLDYVWKECEKVVKQINDGHECKRLGT